MKPIQAIYEGKEDCYILKFISDEKGYLPSVIYVDKEGKINEDSAKAFTIVDPSFFFKEPFPKAMKTSHATPA